MYSSDEYLPTGRLRLGWKYSTSQGAHDKQRVYWENPSRHSVANVEAFETEEERILDDTDEESGGAVHPVQNFESFREPCPSRRVAINVNAVEYEGD